MRQLKLGLYQVAEMCALYKAGWSTRALASHFGIGKSNVPVYLRRAGLKLRPRERPMEKNHFWKGGQRIDKGGYILVKAPGHPYAASGGYVRLHRLVMERQLGRYLTETEVVHHKNRDRQNNLPENLELFERNSDHLRHELINKCPQWTEDGLCRMREATDRKRVYRPPGPGKGRPGQKRGPQPRLSQYAQSRPRSAIGTFLPSKSTDDVQRSL